jgi:hypothetical protein
MCSFDNGLPPQKMHLPGKDFVVIGKNVDQPTERTARRRDDAIVWCGAH